MKGFAPILVALALLATVPLITSSNVVLNFMVMALLIALVGQGWNLLGGMGSVTGAMLGGLFVGVVESLSGLYLGESLGQIGIFVMFILVLLLRPNGLFGERA